MENIKDMQQQMIIAMIAINVGFAIGCVAIGLFVVKVVIRPISKLIKSAEKIAEERARIESGEWDVFTGPIETNTGDIIDPDGKGLDEETITSGINWYFKNIVEK